MIQIYQAIKEKHNISFNYRSNGIKKHKVQPVAIGFTASGKLCLRAYDMPASGWKLFEISKIFAIELKERFYTPKARYNWSGDKQLKSIIIKL